MLVLDESLFLEAYEDDTLHRYVLEALEFLIKMGIEFPSDKYLAKSWADWLEGIESGIDDELETAENLVDIFKDLTKASDKESRILYANDILYRKKLEILNKLKSAISDYISDRDGE